MRRRIAATHEEIETNRPPETQLRHPAQWTPKYHRPKKKDFSFASFLRVIFLHRDDLLLVWPNGRNLLDSFDPASSSASKKVMEPVRYPLLSLPQLDLAILNHTVFFIFYKKDDDDRIEGKQEEEESWF